MGMLLRRDKYILILFSTLCLISFTGFPAISAQILIDSSRQFDFARTCMKSGDFDTAIVEFNRFIHFFPDDSRTPEARCLIGICHMEARRFEAARKVFFRIADTTSAPRFRCRALLLIGESYYRQKIPSEAAYYFRQVIEECRDPEMKNMACYRLGWTRLQEGRWREASGTFRRVGKGSPFYESAGRLAVQGLKGETIPLKKPAVAGAMAALVPGMGHVYVSRFRDAMTAFVLNGLFVWAAIESFQHDQEVLGGILCALESGWYTGNIYSAVNCTHKYNRKLQENFRKTLKDQFHLNLFAAGRGCGGIVLTFHF